MKEYEGKQVKMAIELCEKILYFTATIQKVNKEEVTFIDKYKKIYTFKRKNIIEVSPMLS